VTLPSEDRERLLTTLQRVDPKAFHSEVRSVLLAHANIASAAESLRIPTSTLQRWIDRDATLIADIDLDP
jgi:hypothetical protein